MPEVLTGLVSFAIGIYLIAFAIWGILHLRTKLLWRIRRKLIISYLLIGLVPTVLILFFFLLTAFLVFGQVSSFILSASLERTETEIAHIADLAVADLIRYQGEVRPPPDAVIERLLTTRLEPLEKVYPGVSAIYVEEKEGTIDRHLQVGKARSFPLPGTKLPDWTTEVHGGLMQMGDEYVLAGFSAPLTAGPAIRVLFTLPLMAALRAESG
jgi:hypothetical protein